MVGEIPSPYTPPSPPPAKSNLSMLYYGLAVVGTAALVLAIYNLVIIRWCTHHHQHRSPENQMIRTRNLTSSRSFDNSNRNLLSSFKYNKEGTGQEQGSEYECVVCLSVFEEGEEVRQLPRCKHSFHASCIDMWLYSHLDCPLCRAPVEAPVLQRHVVTIQPEINGREGLLNSGSSV